MKKIVLDTNFLLVPYQFKVSIFTQLEGLVEGPCELLLPSGVLSELKKLSKGKGKEGGAARFALKLVSAQKPREVKSSGNVDEWIFRFAKEEGAMVATNDRILRDKLKKSGVKVISLRSRSRLGVI